MPETIEVELPVEEVLRRRLVHPVFLPVYRLDEGTLSGFEALIRVGSEPGGLPGAWLSAAGRSGLRAEFDLLCLEAIAEAGSPPAGASLFVNLSPVTLSDPRFAEVRSRLAEDLVVDLDEREILRARGTDLEIDIGFLRTHGVRLAFDNASATSLLALARVRPDFVKLDRAVVSEIDRDPSRQSLVSAVCRFGKDVGFSVVAEHVERLEELAVLRDVGVDYAQGFFFGTPAPSWQAETQDRSWTTRTDSEFGLSRRLRQAIDPRTACDVVSGMLHHDGFATSVYLERGGLLRCQAHRGHDEVLDGIPPSTSIMSRAVRTGVRQVVPAHTEDPDRLGGLAGPVALVVEPVAIAGEVAGCVSVEADHALASDDLMRIHRCARLLGDRLEVLGREDDHRPLARLARATKELAGLSEGEDIQQAAVRVACEVAGMSSAVLVLPRGETMRVVAAEGPLASRVSDLVPSRGREIAARVAQVSSAYTEPGFDERNTPTQGGLGVLRAAGMATSAALPVRLLGREVGLLIVGDAATLRIDIDRIEALELLADTVARGLDLSGLVNELRDRAMRDPMTGLQNQRAFAEAMGSFGGRRAHRWTLMMADIDGFKAVNDTLGHRTGDRLLADLAAALDDTLRPLDRIFRVGGDEFALILPDLDTATAADIGDRLCDAAAGVLGEFGASLSVGIALPADGEGAEQFIDRADRTLYEAKRASPGTARLSSS